MKIKFIIFLCFFCSVAQADTFNYYFSTSGGGSDCTEVSPCKYVSNKESGYSSGTTAQNKIDGASSVDTVNLYFNRGDTWQFDTASVSTTTVYGLLIDATDPIVNIDAYGTGDKPVFDGMVADFLTTPAHNTTTGPLRYSRMFQFVNDGSSIKNIKVYRNYGVAIHLGTTSDYADNFTMESCDITNFGYAALYISPYHSQNTTISKNLIHTGNQLSRYRKDGSASGYSNWVPAIGFEPTGYSVRYNTGNTVSQNVIYDYYGEAIDIDGALVEYNFVGDTAGNQIFVNPKIHNSVSPCIVRYNLLVHSGDTTYISIPGGAQHNGIVVGDDNDTGTNSTGVEVYGNIIINAKWGIAFMDANSIPEDSWQYVRIFNNTIIDCSPYNLYLEDYNTIASGGGFIHNNSSILYDQTASGHAIDIGDPSGLSTYWAITHNAFWTTGGSPSVDVDWRTNYVITNPRLAGEEQVSPINWGSLATGNPVSIVTIANVTPVGDSSLVDSGKDLYSVLSWANEFLGQGSDYSTLPDSITANLVAQDTWDIGAVNTAVAESGGTATTGVGGGSITEVQLAIDGDTGYYVDITLTGTTWAPTIGEDNAITDAFIALIECTSGAQTYGFAATLAPLIDYTHITRVSDTVLRWEIYGSSSYDPEHNDTIHFGVPGTAVANGVSIDSSPDLVISAVQAAGSTTERSMIYDSNGISVQYGTGRSIVRE